MKGTTGWCNMIYFACKPERLLLAEAAPLPTDSFAAVLPTDSFALAWQSRHVLCCVRQPVAMLMGSCHQ